ncbi:hypothetical protein K435DRAFT_810377 [Dendrothele bispora CBS 962.96]|uniref:Uncharacterized protein n=1 Tax=Dendrothele bispora (strain CBS 962.96) TaxID=1314807 RepID=A0A4S8KV89_DENBC|nr:hypothetical protein K435DRAFT_810377 [Dendrothele bispora CBS 962.96]
MYEPSGITWDCPPLLERNTPWGSVGTSWLRTWLMDYMTPSYLAAVTANDLCEFLDIATQEWLNRYPSDVLPGNPLSALVKHRGQVESLHAELSEIFAGSSDDGGFQGQRNHLEEMFEMNLTRGTVRAIEDNWRVELKSALEIYDQEFPVVGEVEWSILTLISPPKYVAFLSCSPDQLENDFLWFYRDPEVFIADYDLAYAEILSKF